MHAWYNYTEWNKIDARVLYARAYDCLQNPLRMQVCCIANFVQIPILSWSLCYIAK